MAAEVFYASRSLPSCQTNISLKIWGHRRPTTSEADEPKSAQHEPYSCVEQRPTALGVSRSLSARAYPWPDDSTCTVETMSRSSAGCRSVALSHGHCASSRIVAPAPSPALW
eukprot:6556610-Prymnesium_polylepis.1